MASYRNDNALPIDIHNFLAGYPDQPASSLTQNLNFYENKIAMRPDNVTILNFLDHWQGRYDALERSHGFIQWIFPTREHGVNPQAQPLTREEILAFKANPVLQERMRRALTIMLDFYGFMVLDSTSVKIDKTPKYRERWDNLMRFKHNYLRITRILKSLSDVGLERYNVPLLLYILHQHSQAELDDPSMIQSMDRWWIHCVRDDQGRKFIADMTARVRRGHKIDEEEYSALLRAKVENGVWPQSNGAEGEKL